MNQLFVLAQPISAPMEWIESYLFKCSLALCALRAGLDLKYWNWFCAFYTCECL